MLSIVTMLFVIGLLVMICSLMGGELQNATYDANTSNVVLLEQVGGLLNVTGTTAVTYASNLNFAWSVDNVTRFATNVVIPVANYTVNADGTLTNATVETEAAAINISYTYSYDLPNTATNVIGNTTSGIAGVTDWFDIFIVIAAMVVLILLTVIIITAIRGSGLMEGSA